MSYISTWDFFKNTREVLEKHEPQADASRTSRVFLKIPYGSSVLAFEIIKALLALRIKSHLEKTFSIGILGEERKCLATVAGFEFVLGLFMVRRCSLNLSFSSHRLLVIFTFGLIGGCAA